MSETKIGRREFLTSVGVVGAASASVNALAPVAGEAQTAAQAAAAPPAAEAAGYEYLKPVEQAFVEALVDHMIPKDELTGSGTELGIATYIDRALAGAWGKGARLYKDGPWQRGTPNQGYQLPLTPAELYRAAIEGSNAYCRKTFGKDFDRCTRRAEGNVPQGSRRRQDHARGRPAGPRVLRRALRQRHGRHVRRPDLWRQQGQGQAGR